MATIQSEQDHKNSLATELHHRLLNTAAKFAKEHPEADPNVIIGAGNAYICGFLLNSINKDEAMQNLARCYQMMVRIIKATPDLDFSGTRAEYSYPN